jgi:hypothetical protein
MEHSKSESSSEVKTSSLTPEKPNRKLTRSMKDKPVTIAWTRPMLARFQRAFSAATSDVFVFDGHQFVKAYAKYLIEYLKQQELPR